MAESAGTAVVWFRRDLRLAAPPALVAASAGADQLVALSVHDDRLRRPAGAPRVVFLDACLAALDESIGGHLVRRAGDPARVVLDVAA